MHHRSITRAAYHEAGHALAAYHLSIPIASVSILPDEESWGRCTLDPRYVEGASSVDVTGLAVYKLAGMEAEGVFDPRPSLVRGGRGDLSAAIDLLSCVYALGPQVEHLYEACRAVAEAMVRQYWTAVTAIALALLDQETLTGNEVALICNAGPSCRQYRSSETQLGHRHSTANQKPASTKGRSYP